MAGFKGRASSNRTLRSSIFKPVLDGFGLLFKQLSIIPITSAVDSPQQHGQFFPMKVFLGMLHIFQAGNQEIIKNKISEYMQIFIFVKTQISGIQE